MHTKVKKYVQKIFMFLHFTKTNQSLIYIFCKIFEKKSDTQLIIKKELNKTDLLIMNYYKKLLCVKVVLAFRQNISFRLF